jgi:hypothetical protein
VSAHGFSKTAREKIERAGGSVTWLRGAPADVVAPRKTKKRRKPAVAEAADGDAAEVDTQTANETAEEV